MALAKAFVLPMLGSRGLVDEHKFPNKQGPKNLPLREVTIFVTDEMSFVKLYLLLHKQGIRFRYMYMKICPSSANKTMYAVYELKATAVLLAN